MNPQTPILVYDETLKGKPPELMGWRREQWWFMLGCYGVNPRQSEHTEATLAAAVRASDAERCLDIVARYMGMQSIKEALDLRRTFDLCGRPVPA